MRTIAAITIMWLPAVICFIIFRFEKSNENYPFIVKIVFCFLLANRNFVFNLIIY